MLTYRHSYSVLLLCALWLPSCGGGGGGSPPATLAAFQDPLAAGTDLPEVVLEGGTGLGRFWTNATGAVVGAQLTDKRSPSSDVRVTLDAGELVRIDNVADGSFVLVETNGGDRVDFSEYGPTGDYLGGTAVVKTPTGYATAGILGAAGFDGQIAGQLELPSLTGSYALVTRSTSELDTPTQLDTGAIALVEALASEIVVAGGPAPALGNLSPTQALRWGGLVQLSRSTTASAPTYAAAALANVLSGIGGLTVQDYVRDRFTVQDLQLQEVLDLATEFTSNPSAVTLANFWSDAIAKFGDGQQFASSSLDSLKTTFAVGSQPLPGVSAISLPQNPTAAAGGPATIQVTLEGQAVWQDGNFYPLTGTLDDQGRIDAMGMLDGTSTTDSLTILGSVDTTINSVTGSCDRNGTAGTVNGSTAPLGQCNVSNQSGGQGTFSFAQFIGPGQGDIVFDYQAFSIPDQFIVRTAQELKFDTGGLVSGGQSITIPIDNEPIVFISVRAPRSGTAWNYTLGCLN